jgi:hypothetical protein
MPAPTRNVRIAAAALSLLVLMAVRFDLAPALRGPAPYPPEWQWRHRPRALTRVAPALPAGAALLALLAWSGQPSALRRPRRSAAVLLGGALLLGGVWPLALLESEDGGAVAHLVRRTASPGYLSYHAVAVSPAAADTRAFLRGYPQALPSLPVHAATHPPGPVLFFRVLIAVLDDQAGVRGALDALVTRACGAEADGCGPNVAALTPSARAAALAGPLLLHAAAILTLLPIAALAFQLTRDRLAAARVAALWPLVPGAALFLPALDPALALPVTLALVALRSSITDDTGARRLAGAIASGLAAAVAGFLSYGSGLFLLLGAGVMLLSLPRGTWSERRARIVAAASLAAMAVAAVFAAALAFGHDVVASAAMALAIHAEQYTARRSYGLWLVYGPIDLALFLGVPVAAGLLARAAAGARRVGDWPALVPSVRLGTATSVALLLLFLGGFVRGEVGRLLVPLMPLALLGGVLRLDDAPGPEAREAVLAAVLLMAFDVVFRLNWRI